MWFPRFLFKRLRPAETTASLADELYQYLEQLTAEQGRPIEADEIISAWCPRCNARRRRKAEAMRRWRAKRRSPVTHG
jgi:hypothetical protein